MSDKIPVRVWDINGPIFRPGASDLTVQFCLYMASREGGDKGSKLKKRIQNLAEAYEKGEIGFQPFAKTAYRQINFGARPILLTSTPRPVVEGARIIMPGDVDFILST